MLMNTLGTCSCEKVFISPLEIFIFQKDSSAGLIVFSFSTVLMSLICWWVQLLASLLLLASAGCDMSFCSAASETCSLSLGPALCSWWCAFVWFSLCSSWTLGLSFHQLGRCLAVVSSVLFLWLPLPSSFVPLDSRCHIPGLVVFSWRPQITCASSLALCDTYWVISISLLPSSCSLDLPSIASNL